MPARKRAIAEGEESSSAPGSPTAANKRARTRASRNENEGPRSQRKGKAKAVNDEQTDEDEGDEEGGVDIDIEEETNEDREEKDKQFEAQYYDKIMASVKSRDRYRDTVADYGIIEKVDLYQFMCHQRLTFSFGPQINFIIGHNGSGKSAVLSAITIALGGKTASTGRGNGLKAFIREGQSAAEVSIQLKNKSDEAYRHKDFGDSIVISRRFTAEGSSTWKIKSKDGKVISTKREELSKICDHMNIQVDNPMTVLTQDASRVFLASSNPAERYNLFLKGTQLQQLADEYSVTLENIRSTSKVLDQKKEAIPDLRVALQDAKRRFEEADNARKQKAKQDDLKKEMAWAHVKNKENELMEKMRLGANLESKLPRIQVQIDAEKAKLDEATEEFTQREQAFDDLGDIKDLEKRRAEAGNAMKTNKNTIARLNADKKTMNTNMEALRTTIAELDQQIERETTKMAQNAQSKRNRLQDQLMAIHTQISTHESNITAIQTQRRELEAKKTNTEQQGRQLEERKKDLEGQIGYHEQMIKNCEQAEKDSLLPYGRNIKGVVDQINQMKWCGNKPLGPLGSYVKAQDSQTWGDILRSQLGQQLMSFAITDPRDRNPLKELLARTQNNHVQIIISSTELFDYAEGEPPTEYLTVLRALEINNPLVTRILINSANIESRVLAKTRLEAQRSLERLPKGGIAYTLDQFTVRVFPDGVSSIPLDIKRRNDSSNLMLTGRNTANEIGRTRQEIVSLRQTIAELTPTISGHRKEYKDCMNQILELSKKERDENTAIRRAQGECQKLNRELNEEMPVNVNGLIDAKKEAEAEIASILLQFEPVVQELKSVDAEQHRLLTEMNEIKKKINVFSEKRNSIQRDLENAAEVRLRAQGAVQHYENRLGEEMRKVDQEKQAVEVLQQEFVAWTEKASEYCERVENPRPVQELDKLLKSVGEALKARERRQGASLEELENQLFKAKDQYQKARTDIRAMAQLIHKLHQSLINRYSRWEGFRRHIALRTKVVFQYHLSQRGYFGKLLFDHGDKPKLVLKVQTDDQASQTGHKEKDPRSLSGGEKSFSTICLLLALWESIGCPIRCLDEFDVFMDAVNRRISMKMMIDTANASNQKQYILITPLEMANISFGNTVRVHKMSDPQRNQGTLGF